MKIPFKASFIGLFCLLSFSLQSSVPLFTSFNKNEGLDNKFIKAIAEDNYGYIWVGTTSGIYKFNSDKFIKLTVNKKLENVHVSDLFIDNKNDLWIGTKKNGLLLYSKNVLKKIQPKDGEINSITKFATNGNNRVWVGTSKGVYTLSKNRELIRSKLKSFSVFSDKNITALTYSKSNILIVSYEGKIKALNLNEDKLSIIDIASNKYVHDLHVDIKNNLWIANSERLIRYNLTTHLLTPTLKLQQATRILSIVELKNNLWVASIDGGLYKINLDTDVITQFTINDSEFSLLENNIMTLFISKSENLWIGNFSKGLSLLNLNKYKFSYETNIKGSFYCADNPKVNSVIIDKFHTFWIGTDKGLIKYNSLTNTCSKINPDNYKNNYVVYSLLLDDEIIWLSTSKGLLGYNHLNNSLYKATDGKQISKVFFSIKRDKNFLIIGTNNGLYLFSTMKKTVKKIIMPNANFLNVPITKYAKNSKNEMLFPTSAGILYLDSSNDIKNYTNSFEFLKEKTITAIHFNANDELFIGVLNQGLYHIDSKKQLIQHYFDNGVFSPSNYIMQIQSNNSKPHSVWLGSINGLIQLDTVTKKSVLFTNNLDGNYLSLTNSSLAFENNLLFAGLHGFVNFNPNLISTNQQKPKLIFNKLYLNRKEVIEQIESSNGFVLDKPIEEKSLLNFGYKDTIIDLEFVYLNFYDVNNTKYFYKLEPVFTQWVEINNGNKHLNFTNLKHGNYKLSLKAINKLENNKGINLEINIAPAPWLTWWAYVCYALLLLFISYLLIRHKINKQDQQNKYLRAQVSKQTQHIQKQKEELEELIVRKDEIFANVTHEFKTPITLIKGPIAQLLKQETDESNLKILQMVQRNSNRLLRLVNQILQLSLTIENNKHKFESVKLAVRLRLIAEPYLYHAQKQGLSFSYDNLDDSEISITDDALELTVGNFLSNAFKYTKKGGVIKLGTTVHNDGIEIYVKDNGIGFNAKQKKEIFKRFGRINFHQNIEGSGIGLAIVKEVAEINHAKIKVVSEVNKGSLFSIFFPIKEINLTKNIPKISKTHNTIINEDKATVLIIEDNKDMREYINNVLRQDFNCLLEENGQAGIARALKSVPDVIVSDVMMPFVDGFQLCRIIRSDIITSHIPLILLTALSEKSSRIKGWREGMDMYINKPFDADELVFQIKNVLKIRSLLNKKNQRHIQKGNYSEFTEVDGKFIKKLKDIIEENYRDTFFTLQNIASLMFVSERQLQRKTKALLNMSPLDFLREHRFKNATSLLKKGYQVSITSDNCGFSSVSYFSQIFKKRYGVSPKEYQTMNKLKK